ncbi:hypothetical protein SME20J_35510 [Serratia marcescens]|nr:hypothetical protein SME20J_35510 [Serratia marcescens]
MSRNVLKARSIMFIVPLVFSAKAYALNNKDCYASSAGEKGYTINYKLNTNDILVNTPIDTVVGKIYAETTSFSCLSAQRGRWYLQTVPNASPVPGRPTICKTNIPGIGIQYLNNLGKPIDCNFWDAIFSIPQYTTSGTLNGGLVLANLIRIDGQLDNGEHQLQLSSFLTAYYYGITNGSLWGDLVLQGSGRVYISAFHPQIYFPTSPNNNPVIRLKTNKKQPGSNLTNPQDSTTLDMCLYDGNNSTSNGIKLTFKENTSGVSDRASGLFSIFRAGGDNNLMKNRVDYAVSVINPITGSLQKADNGVDIYWQGVNARRFLKEVILPDIPGISLCVPAPITLSTSSLNISEKMAGNYSGILTIIYTPST